MGGWVLGEEMKKISFSLQLFMYIRGKRGFDCSCHLSQKPSLEFLRGVGYVPQVAGQS